MLPPLSDEPRLDEAIECFNRGDYETASDIMEELFFEAAGGERPLARVLLQFFVGMVHVAQAQSAPAVERIEVGLAEVPRVSDWIGIDGASLAAQMSEVARQVRTGGAAMRPRVERRRV